MAQPCLLVVVMRISSWQCQSRNCQLAIVFRCKLLGSAFHSGLFLHNKLFSTIHYIWICWGVWGRSELFDEWLVADNVSI